MNQETLKEIIDDGEAEVLKYKRLLNEAERILKIHKAWCTHENGTTIDIQIFETEYEGMITEEHEICLLCDKIISVNVL